VPIQHAERKGLPRVGIEGFREFGQCDRLVEEDRFAVRRTHGERRLKQQRLVEILFRGELPVHEEERNERHAVQSPDAAGDHDMLEVGIRHEFGKHAVLLREHQLYSAAARSALPDTFRLHFLAMYRRADVMAPSALNCERRGLA